MDECFREAARTLGYPSLKPEQEKVLSEFIGGKDVFVSLPTGFGKSLCREYAVLPLAFELRSPEIWLHRSQAIHSDCGVTSFGPYERPGCCVLSSVCSVTHEITVTEVREGNYQLLYFSPESLCKRQCMVRPIIALLLQHRSICSG